jgi:hypothetical protein
MTAALLVMDFLIQQQAQSPTVSPQQSGDIVCHPWTDAGQRVTSRRRGSNNGSNALEHTGTQWNGTEREALNTRATWNSLERY